MITWYCEKVFWSRNMLDTVVFLSESCGLSSLFIIGGYSSKVTRKNSSWILLLLHILLINIFIYSLQRSFHKIEWPCFNVNDCAVWLLSWNHFTVAILIQLSAVGLRRKKVIQCVEEAEKLALFCFHKQKKSRRRLVWYFICLVIILVLKSMVSLYIKQTNDVFILVLYNMAYLPPFSMECLVLLLCSVVEDTCHQINNIIAQLPTNCKNVVKLSQVLRALIEYQQEAANLLDMVSRSFEKDLLVGLVFNIIWFIIYIYVTAAALFTKGFSGTKKISLILDLIFLTTRVCFLSYSVNRIEGKIQNTVCGLRKLHRIRLNPTCMKLVDRFLKQVSDNEMKMDICGLFHVDSSFMRGVISLTTTYLIVFIQYGFAQQPSTPIPATMSSTTWNISTTI